MPRHSDLIENHVPHFRTYADEAARVAAVSGDFEDPADLFKWARQASDQTYWVLEQINPFVVWNQLGGGIGAAELPFDAVTDPVVNAAVTTAIINLNSGIVITLTAPGNSQTLQAPTDATAGRKFFVLNNNTSNNPISVNSASLSAGQYAEFRWDGDAWLLIAGGSIAGAGGADTEIQYNKTGVITGDPNYTWDDANKREKVLGDIQQVRGEAGNLYTPIITSSTPLGTNPRYSVPQGNYTCIVDNGSNDLKVFDTTDPTAPFQVGSVTVGGARGLDWSGRYAVVVENVNDLLQVVDLIDKSNPVIVGSITITGTSLNMRGVRIRGRTVFITNNATTPAFISVDITDPTNPKQLDSLDLGGNAKVEFDVVENVALVVTNNIINSFYSIDVTDPSNMTVLDVVTIAEDTQAVRVQGRYAYVLNEITRKLHIFDISDPANLTQVSETLLVTSGAYSPRVVDIQGDIAYVIGTSVNRMVVMDVSDPTAPAVISTEAVIGNNPVSMAVVGRYAQITDNAADTFLIVDVGGATLQNLNVGAIDAGSVNVRGNLKAGGVLSGQSLGVGFGGIYSDGDVVARGRVVAGEPKNVVEIYKETDFPITGGDIVLISGVVYRLMAPVTTDKQILHPVSVTFNPAEIQSSSKQFNTLTSTGTGGAFLKTQVGQGQLVFRNIVILNTGSRVFADISGNAQTEFILELTDADVFGFDIGTVMKKMFFIATNDAFWQDSGDIELIDCSTLVADMFGLNTSDSGLPTFDVKSGAGSIIPTLFSARHCRLSNAANEAFFMLHSNLIAGSVIRINDMEPSPFTPGTGAFYASQSGSITALANSAGAPGVRTVVVSAGHNVADGDTVTHTGFTSVPAFNGTFVASNVTLTQYEVVAVFAVTDTGTWTNISLDQKDSKVAALDNPGQPDSKAIACAHVNDNVVLTLVFDADIFQDINLTGIAASSNIERWALTGAVNGELTYQGIEPFSGFLIATFSGVSASGTNIYKFSAAINGTVPSNFPEAKLEAKATIVNTTLIMPISVVNGDTVRLQIKGVGHSTNATIQDVSLVIQ